MFVLESRVTRLGQKHPIGVIKQINDDNTFLVLWGVSDCVEYTETIHLADLQLSVV